MPTLYPVRYGTRMVTFDELQDMYEPLMHPEAWRRGSNFILDQDGFFGIGGGYRAPGTQPVGTKFAPEGQSFHQWQKFPSGLWYVAWDMVVVNPGGVHRSPKWSEVPAQGTVAAKAYGVHMNVGEPGSAGNEPWHMQPIELDAWGTWVNRGRPDLEYGYLITRGPAAFQPSTEDDMSITPTIMHINGANAVFIAEGYSDGLTDIRWTGGGDDVPGLADDKVRANLTTLLALGARQVTSAASVTKGCRLHGPKPVGDTKFNWMDVHFGEVVPT